jgi:hypothetical protein
MDRLHERLAAIAARLPAYSDGLASIRRDSRR